MTAPGSSGRHAQAAPATRAMVSASLLLPTMIAFFLRSTVVYQMAGGEASLFRADVWNMALTAATDVYFVVVVAVRARSASARVTAVLLGMLATILDLVTLALVYYTDYGVALQWCGNVGGGIALMLFVASWGVARRRRATWRFGLIPTFAIAVAVTLLFQLSWGSDLLGDLLLSWYVGWLLWVGAFVLGALCCWAFDVEPSVRTSADVPAATPSPVYTAS